MALEINVQGSIITVVRQNENDFISLTDMAKFKNPEATGIVITHWMSTRYTVEFMGFWEKLNNPDFNITEFSNIRNESGSNGFVLSTKQWVEKTSAIGIYAKAGRHNSGTFAHKDIAFEFASWISVEFKLYLIKEFQRLKDEEHKQLGWDIRRNLAKINYRIHTDAIKQNLIPPELSKTQINIIYANEADLLNMALFGKTAKQWRDENPASSGNIRDYADISQLVCLSNLESLNAHLIQEKLSQAMRLEKLNTIAIHQMKLLVTDTSIKKIENMRSD